MKYFIINGSPHKGNTWKLVECADGIIIASATFNIWETGLLKNLLDHLCHLQHRPCFLGKKALVLTSVGGVGGAGTIKSVTGTLYGIGFNRCYSYV